MARFGAVVTAMVTPFDDEGELDVDTAASLARWLVDNGSDGLVVAGTTGESPVLSDDEKLTLWAAVREAVTAPVIAGSGTNDTRHSIDLTGEASAIGVDAILAVTPYYSRPSQSGLAAHFTAIASATDLPVMLYDIPIRTGRKIETPTLLHLAREVPNITTVKDAAGNPAESARMLAQAPASLELYSGDDSLTLPLLSIGAVGMVGVATHWAAAQFGEMIDAHGKGDVDLARSIDASLIESCEFETGPDAPNPIPAKAMMRVIGQPVGECRLPMGPAPEGLEQEARRVLEGLG